MKYDVFISYSRKDYIDENKQIIPGNIISQIKELFDINGITYWFDEDGVFSGDAFAPIIARNIKSSSIFLFISSENSNASEWTSNEIATAHSYKKKIIPFRYDDSVYNDSVILYIARLDYIEYKNNPNKSLARLLSSVQGYLKDESERVEREKAEEERRRNAEISRQERIAKLNSLRERIENLENRKFDIEKEILTQEKSLSDLRNEKRIIEANISELQNEEAIILGHSVAKETIDNSRNIVIEPNENTKSDTKNFFPRKWSEITSAIAQKHWITNTVQITASLVLLILILILLEEICFSVVRYNITYTEELIFLLSEISALFSLYRIIKNQIDGIFWFTLYCIIVFCFNGMYHLSELSILYTIFISSLFIPKRGKTAWSTMKECWRKNKKGHLASSLSFIIMIIMTVSTITALLIYYFQ